MAEEETGQEAQKKESQEQETFTREYVKELRNEAAKYRTQRNDIRTQMEGQGDYADLKEAAGKWQELEDKQKSDLEKMQDKLAAAEQAATDAQSRVTETLIRAAFIEAASKAGFANPSDAYSLADRSGVGIKDDGEIEGVDKAIKALEGRLPLAQKPAPKTDGGVGSGSTGKSMFTEAEIREQAAMINVDPVLLGETYGMKLEK
jgi:hypothetical protein